MNFKILNNNRFLLKGTNGRFVHLATIGYGVREFMVFLDQKTLTTYIEEITGGHLSRIFDDELWDALAQFVKDKQLNIVRRES